MGPHVFPRPLAGPGGNSSVAADTRRARRWPGAAYWQAVMTVCLLAARHGPVDAATVPIGPPASYAGDAWPSPTRTLWVDRCGRGTAGVCGAVPCSDANA